MARKHFNTLNTPGALFNVTLPARTPTGHGSRSFRMSALPNSLPSRHTLYVWTGFGNGEKHAGDATPSADPREAVPHNDATRSGRALRDGWQPVAVIDRDSKEATFVTHSVYDERHVAHVAACLEAEGFTTYGTVARYHLQGTVAPTTLSRTGVPISRQFRNTDANRNTHRERARERGNALMDFGRRKKEG